MGREDAGSSMRQSPWIQLVSSIPAILTIVFLIVELTGTAEEANLQFLFQAPIPLLVIIISALLLLISFLKREGSSGYRLTAFLVPCFLAPLALLYPWTIAPSHLGSIGWGGARFFLHWLTKYPNFGPVNIEVLAGIGAMLCLAFLPVVFGFLALRKKRLIGLIIVAAVIWVAYVPIIIRLDFNLILAGLYGSPNQSIFFLIYGPATRLMAAVAVLVLLFFYQKKY